MFEKINSKVINISYSKLVDLEDVPWNTVELYETACKLGFDGVKGDVTPSSDGKLIMCHDPSFDFDENGRVLEIGIKGVEHREISDMTYAECKSLEYAVEAAKEKYGYYPKVTELEDLVRVCHKYSAFPYITVRDKQIPLCVDETYRIVKKYDMTKNCMVNSFTMETLETMRKKDKEIWLSYVQDLNIPLEKRMIDEAVELGNCLVCAFWQTTKQPIFDDMYEKSREAIEYAKEKGVILYLAHGVHNADYKLGIERGFRGFQCLTSHAFAEKV
ncbi:MAG: hypothetical protein IJE44_06095 [Clostridia bacterium]|nr:hypothetical protein [Clostridia bacterium]MBQ6895055.1 hypothetical protein [Clostridia bacterium]